MENTKFPKLKDEVYKVEAKSDNYFVVAFGYIDSSGIFNAGIAGIRANPPPARLIATRIINKKNSNASPRFGQSNIYYIG